MDVPADIDTVDDKFAVNDDVTRNLRRLAAAGIACRQTCGIGQQPVYRRIAQQEQIMKHLLHGLSMWVGRGVMLS